MINCPKCGTANQDTSLVCSKCGATLQAPSGRRCPMCGKVNAPTDIKCESCGARLVPLAASASQEPASAPSRPSATDKKAAPPPPAPKQEPAPSAPDDWLSSLRGTLSESSAPEENIPDWLRGEPSAPSEAEPPAFDLAARLGETEAPQQVPDWLSQLAPSEPVVPSPAESVPDWLQQISSSPAPKAEPAPTAPAPSEQVPDWLSQLAPTPPSKAASKPSTPSEPEIPDWLQQPLPTPIMGAPTAGVSTPPPLEEAELPDWLRSLEPTVTTPSSTLVEPQAAPGPELEIPAWMRDLAPAAPEAVPSGPAVVGAPAPQPSETPDWLQEVGGQPAPAEAQAELPDWLKQMQPQAPSERPTPPVVEAPALVEEAAPEPAGELPSWLKELGPSEAPAEPQAVFTGEPALAPAPPVVGAGGLVVAQLPAWLQKLAPTGMAPKEAEKEEPVETEGVLAGVRGPLAAAEIITQQVTGEPRPLRPEIPAADLSRAGALQELLVRGPAVVVRREVESRAQKLWDSTQRWIVFVILLALALVPLLQEQLVYNLGLVSAPQLQGKPAASAVYQNIDKLKPGSLVFIAFDYDATQSPEMDTQARVLLRHLAARKANIEVVSLYPSGPAVAQAAIDQVNATLPVTDRIEADNLGYVAGQDLAVAFIQGQAISASLVIELAATPDTLRYWAEQMTTRPDAPPLFAGVSAGAEPLSLPYYHSQQVKGILVGVPDAVAYRLELQKQQVALGDQDSPARVLAPLASISIANAALAVLIVVGGLIQLVAAGGKRR